MTDDSSQYGDGIEQLPTFAHLSVTLHRLSEGIQYSPEPECYKDMEIDYSE